MASSAPEHSHLVLRAFSIPAGADVHDFSSIWHDFQIDGSHSDGYFNLPGSAERIRVVVGLVNREGRFRPLLNSDVVALPATPAYLKPAAASHAPAGVEPSDPAHTADQGENPVKKASVEKTLDEATILKAMQITTPVDPAPSIKELVESPTVGESAAAKPAVAKAALAGVESSDLASTAGRSEKAVERPPIPKNLDEAAVLESVEHSMSVDPAPSIEESIESPMSGGSVATPMQAAAGASEQLASQWEDIWSEKAPIQLKAEFVLRGRMNSGTRLLLGNETVIPAPGGFFTWRRRLESFDQTWPLLRAALDTPVLPAAPSLEFSSQAGGAEQLLNLHGSLEIEGQVTDPAYSERLPAGIRTTPDGRFKLTRSLPHGAVILSGISLVAC